MSKSVDGVLLRNVEFPEQLLTLDPRSSRVVGDPSTDGPDSRYQMWQIEVPDDGKAQGKDETFCKLWNVGGEVYVIVTDHSSVITTSPDSYDFFALEKGDDICFQVYDGPTFDLGSRVPGTPVELVLNSSNPKPRQLWARTAASGRS